MYLPNVVGFLFGVQAGTPMAIELNRVLRIFALMLIPFSVSQVLLSAYQILGHEKTSVFTATAQTCLLVLGVWFVAELEGVELWWGFAASCALVLLFQLSYTSLRSRFSHEPISPLTMIPQQPKGYTFDHSVKYKLDDVYAALNDIDAFLKGAQVSNATRFDVNVCCEELMTNIAQHSHGRILKQTFDLHIHVNDEGVFVTMKDAGRPFDPIKTGKMADSHIGTEGHEHLGLRLVTNIIPDISYKYMYGQNTVFIWKKAKEKEDGVSR
jgi:anti-sigma regulatory factor (Ser/Thr protein kinase)